MTPVRDGAHVTAPGRDGRRCGTMSGMKTNAGNFFEDFTLGQVIEHATPRTITDLRTPGQYNVDAVVMKNVSFGGSKVAQIVSR